MNIDPIISYTVSLVLIKVTVNILQKQPQFGTKLNNNLQAKICLNC